MTTARPSTPEPLPENALMESTATMSDFEAGGEAAAYAVATYKTKTTFPVEGHVTTEEEEQAAAARQRRQAKARAEQANEN